MYWLHGTFKISSQNPYICAFNTFSDTHTQSTYAETKREDTEMTVSKLMHT